MTMNDTELKQNADFLEIAMEQMDEDSLEYEFVEDVFHNLMEAANK